MSPDPADLLDVALAVARDAAALVRDRPADLQVSSKSTPTDAVTVVDRAAERLILAELRRRRPGDAVLSEETGATAGDSPVTWVVDPLDGTVNYLYGIPHYAVCIAAEVDGEAVAGVVHDVARDDVYAAVKGGGATCNGAALRCRSTAEPAVALLATGFAYGSAQRARQGEVIARVLPQVRDIRRIGAASLDLCAVASGRVDAYVEAGMQRWDWSAAALIAREAGARVSGLGGRPPGSWATLAANPALFAALEPLLLDAGAAEL